jgi:hypothetical protein
MDLKLDSNGDLLFINGESPVVSEAGEDLAQRLTIAELYSDCKGSENGSKYIILDEYEKRPFTRDLISLQCKDCGRVFSQRPNSVLAGVVSCYCSKSPRLSREDFIDNLVKTCTKANIKLITTPNSNLTTTSIFGFECSECKHAWEAKASTVLHMKIGCSVCNKKYKRTREELISEITNLLSGKFAANVESFPETPTLNSRVQIVCISCSSSRTKKVRDLLFNRQNCINCKSYKKDITGKTYLYLLKLQTEAFTKFKLGITYDIEMRRKQIAYENGCEITLADSWEYQKRADALSQEFTLKKLFCERDVELTSGFTETFDIGLLPMLYEVQEKQYRGESIWT